MTTYLKRRQFLGAVVAVGCLPGLIGPPSQAGAAVAAPPEPIDDWAIFPRIAKFFADVWHSTDFIADSITRQRFVELLDGISTTLADILHAKSDIVGVLRADLCGTNAQRVSTVAFRARDEMRSSLDKLRTQINTLSSAIKRTGLRSEATKIGEALYPVWTSKIWIDEAPHYCIDAAPKREALLARARDSRRLVRQCAAELNELIERLS